MDPTRYLSDLSRCVRCGSCKAYCPIYDETASESMSARGRLALLYHFANGTLRISPELHDRIFVCTLCGACANTCPLGIDIKEIIYHGRALLRRSDKRRTVLRKFIDFSTKRPRLVHSFLSLTQHFVLPRFAKKGFIPSDFELPERCLGDMEKVISVPRKKGRVALFAGCMVNFVYPHLGLSLINVLRTLGYEVILPATESCCCAPLRSLGMEEAAKELAKKNIRLFNRLKVEAVLSLCPTCTLTIRHEYPSLVGEGIVNAQDISSFLIDRFDSPFVNLPDRQQGNILYHAPCHLKYGLSIEREPIALIERAGYASIVPKEHRCCGFAGVFSFTFRTLSHRLLTSWMEKFAETSVDRVVTSCPGCMFHLSKGLRHTPVHHLIEVIEEALVEKAVSSHSLP